MWQENEIQLNGSKNAKQSLTNLKSCALAHQFWPMWILGNHLSCIRMQAFLALELSYIKNKMELKKSLVMPINHYQNLNQNIRSIS